MSNYATKSGVEKATRDICNLATKGNLSSLKARKNKLDEDKPKMVPADLSKPNNVIDDNVVKKDVHGKLIAKINSIDTKLPTAKLSPKTQYDWEKQNHDGKIADFDKKIPNTNSLVNKAALNTKAAETENKTSIISNLVTKANLNTKTTDIQNKMLDITNLATKAVLNTKASEIENKISSIADPATKVALNTKNWKQDSQL